MKRICQRIICIFLITVISSIGLTYLSNLVRPKDLSYRKTTFIDNSSDIDVLFLGTSHMANTIYPIELWDEYGIPSYNMGGHGHTLANSYWVMINALDYCKPELIVLDCFSISNEEKSSPDFPHWTMDDFPLSQNKVAAIFDLYEDLPKRIEYLWDFSLYHPRWSELTQIDYNIPPSFQYGGEPLISVATPSIPTDINSMIKSNIDTYGTKYLRKIIEECQKREIDLLLTYLPFPANEEKVNESLNVEEIAREYGVDYINFLKLDIVNFNTDCYDPGSHLNMSGSRKVTKWLGNYIQKTYNIENQKEHANFYKWNEDYKKYIQYNLDNIKEETDLFTYLMLLQNKDFSVCLYIPQDSMIYRDKLAIELINNIPQYQNNEKFHKAITSNKDYFLLVDNGWEKIWECIGNEELENINSTFGNVNYFTDNNRKKLFIRESSEEYISFPSSLNKIPDIQIVVIDRTTGTIEDVKKYIYINDSFFLLNEQKQ